MDRTEDIYLVLWVYRSFHFSTCEITLVWCLFQGDHPYYRIIRVVNLRKLLLRRWGSAHPRTIPRIDVLDKLQTCNTHLESAQGTRSQERKKTPKKAHRKRKRMELAQVEKRSGSWIFCTFLLVSVMDLHVQFCRGNPEKKNEVHFLVNLMWRTPQLTIHNSRSNHEQRVRWIGINCSHLKIPELVVSHCSRVISSS